MQNNNDLSIREWEIIGKRIQQRRKALKFSQGELAEIIDISPTHMSAIERGVQHPSIYTLLRLCEVLKSTPDYFLLGNVRSKHIAQNIIDKLYLCDDDKLDILNKIINAIIE